MAALPYMPLFVADYMADTADLSTAQHGAYLLLIMNYWQRGGALPNDDARLAKITGLTARNWLQMKSRIAEFFECGAEFWKHARIDHELARIADKSLKSKRAAQASVRRRFGERSADGQTGVEPTEADTDKEKKEEQVGGKPPDYAFFGQTIKLKPRDFSEWKRLFHTILDLEAELSVLDGWWQDQPEEKRKSWFHGTKAMLNKRHQTNLAAEKDGDAPIAWDGMP
jgi:uncharacterized protein YdaU (DUF1376 family)